MNERERNELDRGYEAISAQIAKIGRAMDPSDNLAHAQLGQLCRLIGWLQGAASHPGQYRANLDGFAKLEPLRNSTAEAMRDATPPTDLLSLRCLGAIEGGSR